MLCCGGRGQWVRTEGRPEGQKQGAVITSFLSWLLNMGIRKRRTEVWSSLPCPASFGQCLLVGASPHRGGPKVKCGAMGIHPGIPTNSPEARGPYFPLPVLVHARPFSWHPLPSSPPYNQILCPSRHTFPGDPGGCSDCSSG